MLTDRLRRPVDVGRPDGLVCILRPRHRLGGTGRPEVLFAVVALDPAVDLRVGVGGDPRRVGAHVSDQAGRPFGAELHALVELLGHAHRDVRAHSQPARGVLLQSRGDVRRIRALGAAPLLHPDNAIARAFELADDLVGLSLVVDLELLVARLGRRSERPVEPGMEMVLRSRLFGQLDVHRPRLDRDELANLLLTVHYEPQRDR